MDDGSAGRTGILAGGSQRSEPAPPHDTGRYFTVGDRSSNARCFFFFNDTATTEIYTLSLHDALPISLSSPAAHRVSAGRWPAAWRPRAPTDRKSTRLNSSHGYISYAVFCLKKKNAEGARRGTCRQK